jgi:cell division protein FtsA
MRRGVLADLEETAGAISTVVRRVQQDVGQEIHSLVVSVTGAHIESMNAQGLKPIVPRSRLITYQDVMEVINHSRAQVLPPDREQIQAIPREFRVDGQRDVRKPVGMSGSKLEVVTYIVTGQTGAIQNIEKAVGYAGKKVEQMVLAPMASGIGTMLQEEMDLGAAVVDIGGGTADLGVFSNGTIAYSACVPIGSSHITSDVSKLLKTSPEEAERLKTHFGSALAKPVSEKESVDVMQLGQLHPRPLQRHVLAEIIEARMREIATMVRQHLQRSGFDAILPGGVVLTGGGSLLPHTDKLFQETLKHLRVRVAEPDLGVGFGRDAGLATAAGLARFALQCQDEVIPVNNSPLWRDRVRSLFSIISGKP